MLKKNLATKWAFILILIGMMFALGFPKSVKAALTDNGDGTVTDGNGIMWLQSPAATLMTWDEAVAWADALEFAGHDDWRLPSAISPLTGLPFEGTFWGAVPPTDQIEFPYLYMNEWNNPWGSAGGYSLPPDMALMPDYWIMYPLSWWLAEEYDADEAYTFWASWDGVAAQNVELKTYDFLVTAVRDSTVTPEEVPPVAFFTEDASAVLVGTTITFDASGSYDPDGTIVLYEWDFDDDGVWDATGVTASYTYLVPGTFTVILRVTDDDGLTNTASAIKTITPIEHVIPEVPLGTIIASVSMIIALVAYVAMPIFRKKQMGINP